MTNLQPTETYAAAYAQLSAIAEKLKNASAANVDTLADDVRAARRAAGICRARIDAIRAEIDDELASEIGVDGEPT